MQSRELYEMKELEHTYWWHVGRRAIIRTLLEKHFPHTQRRKPQRHILEVGCGTGGNASLLSAFGEVTGADSSPEALALADDAGFARLVHVPADAHRLPFADGTFDCVAILDVLEHIENDTEALRECARVLAPGGALILTVPAYQWLFSGHDKVLGHKRRYTMRSLLGVFSHTVLRVGFRSYAIAFLFPAIAFFRIAEKMSGKKQKVSYVRVPAAINGLFILLLKCEALLLRFGVTFPFGTSIVIYAKKI